MPKSAHLWAIGFDDVEGAAQFRNVLTGLASPVQHLLLLDLAILVQNADGSYSLDRQPFPAAGNILDGGPLNFLAGIALAAPLLSSTAVGDLFGLAGTSIAGAVGLDDKFIRDVGAMMRPGTSAVLMLDLVGDPEETLRALRGKGGTVLRTNVDLDYAKRLQSILRAHSARSVDPENRG